MKVWIDPNKAPLKDVPAVMQPRHLAEIKNALAENGLKLGDNVNADGSLNISLRNLRRDQRQNVIKLLENLGAARIDLEAPDLEKLNGGIDVDVFAVARGLESNVETVAKHLTELRPEEIFEGLDKARAAIGSESISPELLELLRPQVEADLVRAGLLGDRDGIDPIDAFHAALKERNDPEPKERSGEFAEDAPLPYRSPFEESF